MLLFKLRGLIYDQPSLSTTIMQSFIINREQRRSADLKYIGNKQVGK